ncbi:MAG TPA: beta-ketoacyl-ACP synthase 3 [Trebonia sp.]|nr:beta-ketoacyl-ACP synthase 3 [Trebonia sp.]
MTDAPAGGQGRILTQQGGRHARIMGVGGYRPRRVVTNEHFDRTLGLSDQWITRRTGIKTRRFAAPDETLAVMAAAAADKALAQAGLGAASVDCVIVASMSHLRQAPPLAAEITGLLGSAPAAAFDVGAAMAGFCYALTLASHLVSAGTARHAVVIGTERMSDIIDPADQSTSFIFGDGAGAVVVGPADRPGIGQVVWGSHPAGIHSIEQQAPWQPSGDPGDGPPPYLRMAGQEVYRWAIQAMPDVARKAMAVEGLTAADLAAFIPHQSNLRICDALATALDLPEHVRVARDLIDMGNTSAASIPLAMERMLASGEVASGSLALLAGYGAGLGYAAQVVWLP